MRRDRWLSLWEVGELMRKRFPRLEGHNRAALRRYVARCLRRTEARDDVRYSRLHRGRLYVSISALESMLPLDEQVLVRIERDQVELAQLHRHLRKQVNSQGGRIQNLEKWRELTTRYLADAQALVGISGSEVGHDRVKKTAY
jgi:hypothetical protein